jgi:hypothetical protein
MAYISDVANISYLIAEIEQMAIDQVKTGEGPNIAEMNITIYRRATDIHANKSFGNGFEYFFLPGKAIINDQLTH